MRIRELIKKNGIIFSSLLMLTLVVVNLGLIIFNNQILEKNKQLKSNIDQIKQVNEDIWGELVRNIDIGVRGYAVVQDTSMLLPYNQSVRRHNSYFEKLREMLNQQNYPFVDGVDTVSMEVKKYAEAGAFIIHLLDQQLFDSVKVEIKKDKGRNLWLSYSHFTNRLNEYENDLLVKSEAEYSAAMHRTIYLQILLVIIALPSLIFTMVRITNDVKNRKKLFLELETNNRKYLFDPGTPLEVTNEKELIHNSIINFQKAAAFINQISQGDYSANWAELTEANKNLNQSNLAGELVQMREKMKRLKDEDERRRWATEGIAQYSEIVRMDQNNVKDLGDRLMSFVVKYLDAQQGSLFMLREEKEESYLELVACFAFDRKKYLEKRIEIGEGLIGQTFLEKEYNMLIDVPQDYISITSGLGEANPSCLIMVPMKYNDSVEAVIELASFNKFEPYQIEWLEKIGEITASAILAVKTAEKTSRLLEQFRDQTEEMKAQEEELLQNLEELQATQEEMRRKEVELENRQRELQEIIEKNTN